MNAKTVMAAMVEAFNSGDVSGVDALVADDYVDHQGLGSGELRSPEGFRQVVAAARSGFSELSVAVLDYVVEGDKVVARIEWRGTRSTGEIEQRETIDIVRVVNGKAAEHWGGRS
ncbi:MAG: ester cyclase [Ilumatobacteraceae bacterium]